MTTVQPWRRLGVRPTIGLCLAVFFAVIACGAEAMGPDETIRAYVDAYNARDIDGVMAVFAPDAVITGHPFSDRTEGAEAIEQLQRRDIAAASDDNAYQISDIAVAGNTVTWNHVWNGSCVGIGNEAVVDGGRIVQWSFATVTCEDS